MNIISTPKYKWRIKLSEGVYYYVEDSKVPNRFHRVMQGILLGFIWEEI